MQESFWLEVVEVLEVLADKEDICVAELPLVKGGELIVAEVVGAAEEVELGLVVVAFALEVDCVKVGAGVLVALVRDAEYDLHKSVPTVSACCKSVALQAAIKHSPIAARLILH